MPNVQMAGRGWLNIRKQFHCDLMTNYNQRKHFQLGEVKKQYLKYYSFLLFFSKNNNKINKNKLFCFYCLCYCLVLLYCVFIYSSRS